MKKLLILIVPILLYVGILFYPNPFFSHKYEYKNFRVYSDKPIPKEVESVLDDTQSRIEKSELYSSTDKHTIFICNATWRMALFTTHPQVGGVATPFTLNVFIRESDFKNNKIVKEKEIYQASSRPLSYYMAHELTHKMQFDKVSNIMPLTTPKYIIEGYADYIGKEPDFDYDRFLKAYKKKDFFMTIESGMYNRYHLLMAYLMDKKGMTFREIVKEKPSMEEVEKMIIKTKKDTNVSIRNI